MKKAAYPSFANNWEIHFFTSNIVQTRLKANYTFGSF